MLIQRIERIFVLFCFCMCKMNLTSADRYKNADVNFSIIRKTAQIWLSMKNVHNGLGV